MPQSGAEDGEDGPAAGVHPGRVINQPRRLGLPVVLPAERRQPPAFLLGPSDHGASSGLDIRRRPSSSISAQPPPRRHEEAALGRLHRRPRPLGRPSPESSPFNVSAVEDG